MKVNLHERFLLYAELKNGVFSSEKIYYIKTADGQEFSHVGFTSYTFDGQKKRHSDIEWEGMKVGYVEVVVCGFRDANKVVIMPPQCHGYDSSGPIEVFTSSLTIVPTIEQKSYDFYGS